MNAARVRAVVWLVALGFVPGGPGRAAVTRSESGSPPLRWNFDQYLSGLEPPPDQNPSTRAIRFHLGTTVSVRGAQSNEWNAVRAAFGQWQAIPGTKIAFEEAAPRTAPTTVSAIDGHNDVVWLSQGIYGDLGLGERIAFGSGTIALTVLGLDVDLSGAPSGTIVEGDILVNRDLDYLTDITGQSANSPFLESVVLHEIGHLLGLNHSPVGSATLWWYQGGGVGPAAGLPSDELAWARATYGLPATLAGTGTVRGTVKVGGVGLLGALVFAERNGGIVESGTATAADGSFRIPGLPPGTYRLRVQPLDPNSGGDTFLVRGLDLDVSSSRIYENGATSFLGMTDAEFTLSAGAVVERNLAPSAGVPPFRITEMRVGLGRNDRQSGDLPVGLVPGQSNVWVGVYVPAVLPPETVLRITGDGLQFGTTEVVRPSLRQLTLVQVPVTVLPGATPGMRSVQVTANGFTAWASGFVDVAASVPDFNFDGLDDAFQRRYFRPFTQTAAAPDGDPDGDGFTNRREAARGSDPTDAKSYGYRLNSVRLTQGGTVLKWESAAGRKYQVWSRDDLGAGDWVKVGGVVTAAGEASEWTDLRPTDRIRLYRVQDPP